ncbi:PREDICTED: uncharacterized protein LOC103344327 [Prunus mume]|uniref:Uncharacterized protein LOC103344327 n=1 Tax=Prunus mume TaxID=102107 RepID=A0ABM0PXM8_PRUMU|nr:PREDICTED: uncharacterized protein LOC103344327 [Prunus mume]
MNPTTFNSNSQPHILTFFSIFQNPRKLYKVKETRQGSKKIKMSLVTAEIKSKADELYHGDEICQEKSQKLLTEISMPNGLLPLKDMEECGYVKETGFVWLKQKKSTTHKFEKIGKLVSYAPEVTAYVEKGKIKKLTGVKTKELLVWVSLSDIYVDDPPTGKITFKTPSGLFRTFPVSAFEKEEAANKDVKDKKEVKEAKGAVEV